MAVDKGLPTGGTTLMILRLLEDGDMYGYQMIEELSKKSDAIFSLKAGTLYPILHGLENEGMVSAYDRRADSARVRKYYHLTNKGKKLLGGKETESHTFMGAASRVLGGGTSYAGI